MARAVEQVGIRVRDQTVARASRHATVAACSIVIVRDQRVSRASRNHLLVERRLAPRVAVLVQKGLVVDHGLKRMWGNFGMCVNEFEDVSIELLEREREREEKMGTQEEIGDILEIFWRACNHRLGRIIFKERDIKKD